MELDDIAYRASSLFSACVSVAHLEIAKSEFLGKTGLLAVAFQELCQASPQNKKSLGLHLNQVKNAIQEAYAERLSFLKIEELNSRLNAEFLDVSLPGRDLPTVGSRHPLRLVEERMLSLLSSFGFLSVLGPEVEDDWHNFTALNTPMTHPARSMHDTFYLSPEKLLRTHSSSVQVRYMSSRQPPFRIVSSGRVYRVDSDATHSPVFHQLEGLWVEEGVGFLQLRHFLTVLLQAFFNTPDLKLRFRASFFPFTEPSAEVDIACVNCNQKGCQVCSYTGWLELLGCGVVHQQVLKNCHIDATIHQGVAWGVGLDRLAMLYYGVNDIRLFYENQVQFLKQF